MKKLGDLLKALVRSKVEKVRETVDSLKEPPESHEGWRPPARGEDLSDDRLPQYRCPACAWEGEIGEAALRLSDPRLTPHCPGCGAELGSRS